MNVRAFNVRFGRQVLLQGQVLSPDVTHPVPGAILCHGLGSGQGAMRPSGLSLAKQGIVVLVFDFRGHGRSGGIFDGNTVEDVIDAWQWLSQFDGVDKERIALIGHSMGARAAILATSKVDSPCAPLWLCLALQTLIIWQFGGTGMLIAYPVVLLLFCSAGSLPEFKTTLSSRKGLIFDREYHFWQARKR